MHVPARTPRTTFVFATLTAVIVWVLLGAPAAWAQPPAPRPPWGACGNATAEDKVVARFAGGISLLCGGPLHHDEPEYGYRHIRFRHQGDLENLRANTTIGNWRDLADLAMDTIAKDPDVDVPAPGNQICMSRVLFLANERTGQVIRQQIFVMYVDARTRTINTLTPRGTQC
jgi:hypothetical protein